MAVTRILRDEVWVWLPREREGALLPTAPELLYEAQGLCRRLGASLVAGSDLPPEPEERALLQAWGVRRVWHLPARLPPHPVLTGGPAPLDAALAEGGPRVFLFSADATGRVLAPFAAAESGAVFVPGATSVTLDGRHFVVARPTLGEQFEALATLEADSPLVVTLQPGAVGEPEAGGAPALAQPPELSLLAGTDAGTAPPPHLVPPDPESVDIAEAERIVAFGRGAFAPQAVELVQRLAKVLGAAVAGTRPAADEGWLPFERQVGLTGQIVRPKLYVAVGISGAPYHMVGIKDPETLVAINADPEAPIFGAADLGLVGDLYTLLPALLQALEHGASVGEATEAAAATPPLRGRPPA